MKRFLCAAALAFAQSALLLAQAPGTSYCEMKVVSVEDHPAHLTITVKNISRQSIVIGLASPVLDYKVQVASVGGREADRTAFGKRVLAGDVRTRFTSATLGEGESYTEDLDISHLFELTTGLYNVVLTRAFFVDRAAVRISAAVQIRIP